MPFLSQMTRVHGLRLPRTQPNRYDHGRWCALPRSRCAIELSQVIQPDILGVDVHTLERIPKVAHCLACSCDFVSRCCLICHSLEYFYFPFVDQLLREWLEIMLLSEGVLTIEARFWLQNTTQRCGDFPAKQSRDLEAIRQNKLPSQPNFTNSQKSMYEQTYNR